MSASPDHLPSTATSITLPAQHFPHPMRITTPTSTLRDWSTDDAAVIVKYANNPKIASHLRDAFPSPYTQEDADRFIAFATGPGRHLYLAIDIGGEAIGGIGISPLEDVKHRTAEIGYWLAEPFWGRGIATGAVRALVPVAFETTGIVRLEAGIFSDNPASMRVLEKCGFLREAVHKKAITKNGRLLDEVMYVRFRDGE
ncbi:GNAT family N-acetyltransferase [Methanoregula sp. UBA64]|jgi:[ribosomal protein S5]-alanine N-acetyltransferase|uniref:GNAT family N-acetyltransferase n=1 Tax=Methanoregula sp. UBA64 TaxID=1915554 RepID=UPI0025EAB924|nr:GNAT family protein [Methanoregula sp. UBA64]